MAALQEEINAALNHASTSLRLNENVTATPEEQALQIPLDKVNTIDLNGYTLSRGMDAAAAVGCAIQVNDSLTVTDSADTGIITGGAIVNNGKLTIRSGSISDNQAAEGGAIYNGSGATLTMTGGTISGNTSKMNGGGIWSAGTLNLSGDPVVSGNMVRNLYLRSAVSVQMTGTLLEDLRVGLSCQSYPADADLPKVIATGVTGYTGGFVCDSDGYIALVTSAGELQLIFKPAYGTPDFTLPGGITTIEDRAFEGVAMKVVYIPDGCTGIGAGAFRDCAQLTSIRIPDGCAVNPTAFDGCGTVFVYGTPGSAAESFCQSSGNCVFIAE